MEFASHSQHVLNTLNSHGRMLEMSYMIIISNVWQQSKNSQLHPSFHKTRMTLNPDEKPTAPPPPSEFEPVDPNAIPPSTTNSYQS